MDLGKPISRLPKPHSPTPVADRSESHALADWHRVTELADESELQVPEAPAPTAEPVQTSVHIPMPGIWKFGNACQFFVMFLFLLVIAVNRRPSLWWPPALIAIAFLIAVWRICTSSISGTTDLLVVPSGAGLGRRALTCVKAVSISNRILTRRGVWALRFVSNGRQTRALVVPRLPWDLIKPSPLDRPPGDREWIAHAVPALMAAGIDVTDERR